MKNFITQYKFALLFIFFLLLATIINRANFSFENNKPNVNTFSQILFDKEFKTDAVIDSLFIQTENKNLAPWVNKNSNNIDFLFKEQGLVFLVYLNSNLVYWTSNSIAIPDSLFQLHDKFAKLGNSYVEIRKKQNDTIAVIGLISIMDSHKYENNFLINGLHTTFNLDCPHTLVIDSTDMDFAIFSKELNYLFSLKNQNICNPKLKERILVALILLTITFLLLFGRDNFNKINFSLRQFTLFGLILIAIRTTIQVYRLPSFLTSLKIFQPQYFAYSNVFPSLGDLLITVVLAVFLIFVFYSKVKLKPVSELSGYKKYTVIVLWVIGVLFYAKIANQLFAHLIIDSSFQYEAFDVLGLTLFSFIGYFILLMLFVGLILLIDKACIQIKGCFKIRHINYFIFCLGLVLVLVNLAIKNTQIIFSLLFLFSILIFWINVRLLYAPRFGMVVILIAVFSAFSTKFIREQNVDKRKEESKVIAVNLAHEKDPIAEVIFAEVITEMKLDTALVAYLQDELFDFNDMAEYIKRTYFTGYLGRYNFQLTICNDLDSVLLDENKPTWQYCYGFFNDLLKSGGVETNITGLYYLRDNTGGLNYFMRVPVNLSNNWRNVTLFYELTSKPNIEVLGYPELLLEKSIGLHVSYNLANYAKYEKNQLIERSGDFPYALERDIYGFADDEFAFFQAEGYDHLLYNSQVGHTVLVSFPTVHFYNIVISFTYIFFFLLIQTILLLLIGNRFTHFIDFNFSIKIKIVFSMILILLTYLFFVGGGTIMYTYNRFEKGQIDILSEKIQSVLVELEHKIADYNNIHEISPDYINSMLVNFSNVFYTDINVYDVEGNLAGTSRKEIFERNLTGKKINAIAFRELVLNKKARIVHKEQIGKMEYYSAYVPLINSDNELLAYINLPYFAKEVLLRKELLNVVVAVINIYAFLLVISILIAVYISNLLTEPLRMVQQRIRNIDLSKINERIDYQAHDEIGDLVVEYNRMLGELDKSAKLLAKSERESAWREMARQIAHEINNPLTPMKLSIQLLDKSWKNKDDDFEQRFQRSTKTLIEQIDSLSSIATAFSQFARMPIARSEKVNIIERINQSAELFKEVSYASFDMHLPKGENVFVLADNERMLQVFNNLVKNAIQSIPSGKMGKVVISLTKTETNVVVEINDNGVGILPELEDKLFQPNFTTKTSGTGLGLAIVKNIVEEFGGAIWFKSELGKGSSFFISMPVYTDSRSEDFI